MDSGKLHVVQFSRSSISRCLSDSLFILAQPIPFCQPFFQKFFREFSADFCLLPCSRSLCCSLRTPALTVLDYITTPFSFCQLFFLKFFIFRRKANRKMDKSGNIINISARSKTVYQKRFKSWLF